MHAFGILGKKSQEPISFCVQNARSLKGTTNLQRNWVLLKDPQRMIFVVSENVLQLFAKMAMHSTFFKTLPI